MSYLYGATITVNLLALVLAIWLGLFLISRNPNYLVAWLMALMLWLMGLMFLNVLLALNPPPVITLKFTWVRIFFPFWPQETVTGMNNNWLQGWSVAPALALWHHVTVQLLPGRLTTWRWVRIFLVYLLAVIATILQANAQILFTAESSDLLYLNSLQAGPWFPIFVVALLLITWTCVYNLVIAARNAPLTIARNQFQILAWVSLVGGLAGFTSIVGSYFMVPIPILVISLLEGVTVGLIGLSVGRYSAFMQGRTIQKDFLYSLLLLGLVLLIYLPISLVLIGIYHAPMAILAVFPALAVITHSSMAAAYRLMDRFFYKQETRQLRLQLRQLWRTAGVNGTLETLLGSSLETLCHSVQASYGVVFVLESQTCKRVASCQLDAGIPELDAQKLSVDDALPIVPNRFPPPLNEAELLVPLYGETDQVGALILGRPVNGLHYAPEDVDQILDYADRIGETIQTSHRYSQYVAQITQLVQVQDVPGQKELPPISTEWLEPALRNMNDYAYLGDTPLAELKLVQTRILERPVTHLERGKVVHTVLHEALEKLRPGVELPAEPPPREWYPYLILQGAYVEETSNRDIMLKLYISEGSFNRTRRAAIRSLARTMGEMEASIP